jgi:hypothetical protein
MVVEIVVQGMARITPGDPASVEKDELVLEVAGQILFQVSFARQISKIERTRRTGRASVARPRTAAFGYPLPISVVQVTLFRPRIVQVLESSFRIVQVGRAAVADHVARRIIAKTSKLILHGRCLTQADA